MKRRYPRTTRKKTEYSTFRGNLLWVAIMSLIVSFLHSNTSGYILLAVYLLIIFYLIRRRFFDKNSVPTKTMKEIDCMDGYDFESYIGKIYRNFGYSVKNTPSSGDQGADLVISKDGENIAVQTKCYSNKVSNKAVQEVVASKALYKCSNCMVITNNYFTKSAIELAKSNDVELVDREDLKSLIKNLPGGLLDSKEELLNEGRNYSDIGKYYEAIEYYDKALNIDPDYKLALINKGLAFSRLHSHEKALEAYDKAIQIDPNIAAVWSNKGNSLEELGLHEEALKAYSKAIEIDPNITETWDNKNFILEKIECKNL